VVKFVLEPSLGLAIVLRVLELTPGPIWAIELLVELVAESGLVVARHVLLALHFMITMSKRTL